MPPRCLVVEILDAGEPRGWGPGALAHPQPAGPWGSWLGYAGSTERVVQPVAMAFTAPRMTRLVRSALFWSPA